MQKSGRLSAVTQLSPTPQILPGGKGGVHWVGALLLRQEPTQGSGTFLLQENGSPTSTTSQPIGRTGDKVPTGLPADSSLPPREQGAVGY